MANCVSRCVGKYSERLRIRFLCFLFLNTCITCHRNHLDGGKHFVCDRIVLVVMSAAISLDLADEWCESDPDDDEWSIII